MVIRIEQVKNRRTAEFGFLEEGNLLFRGRVQRNGSSDIFLGIYGLDGKYIYRSEIHDPPVLQQLAGLVSGRKAAAACGALDAGGRPVASFSFSCRDGIWSEYEAVSGDGRRYSIYPLCKGRAEHLLVFEGETQLAQITRETTIRNNLDAYLLYLPDAHAALRDLLCLFVLYYDQKNHPGIESRRRGAMLSMEQSSGTKTSWSWTWSEANLRYDPQWMADHFPDALLPPLEITEAYNQKVQRNLRWMRRGRQILLAAFLLIAGISLIRPLIL